MFLTCKVIIPAPTAAVRLNTENFIRPFVQDVALLVLAITQFLWVYAGKSTVKLFE